MKMKKISALLLVVTMFMNLCVTAYASEPLPEFAITDDTVIIEYVPYKITDNTIQYDGKVYEIQGTVLVTYDDEGPICLVLPFEQNKVTDLEEISRLNAMVGQGNQSNRAVPENPIDLPYSANVSEGDYDVITPTFKIIEQKFSYYTNLKITGLPFVLPRPLPGSNIGEFLVIFAACDFTGTWTKVSIKHDFAHDGNTYRWQNYSSTNYGFFSITNLYGNPSPAYKYEVFKSAFG